MEELHKLSNLKIDYEQDDINIDDDMTNESSDQNTTPEKINESISTPSPSLLNSDWESVEGLRIILEMLLQEAPRMTQKSSSPN